MVPGEQKAWDILLARDPEEVCRSASVSYDIDRGVYRVRSFGRDFLVSPQNRAVSSDAIDGYLFLKQIGYFFHLSIIWYMASAKDVSPSGRLVKPENCKGGQIFFRGTHVLPLQKVADKFGEDVDSFLRKCAEFGSERCEGADGAARFYPFPRIPTVLMFWRKDEEFPARAELYFDMTCDFHLPIDVIWSIAMTNLLILL